MSERILIVEDDKSIRTIVEYALKDAGFEAVSVERGDAALESVTHDRIDLVVLESQGPMFCHRVLSEGRRVYEADRERRVDFESDAYVRYFDFKPTWDIAARHAMAGLRRKLERQR